MLTGGEKNFHVQGPDDDDGNQSNLVKRGGQKACHVIF